MAKQQQKTTIQKLEAVLPGAGAQMRAMAAPYAELARTIATSIAASKVHAERAKGERSTLWDSFKNAIDVALTVGHNAGALQSGLSVACEEAGVPSGSYRGYASTIVNLFTDLTDGKLTREQVASISVKDAREMYMDTAKKEAAALQERLLNAWKQLDNAEKLALLASIEKPAQSSKDAPVAQAA